MIYSATGVTIFCIRTDWCMILATGVTMYLYTHRLMYDIFSNRVYDVLYTHRLVYDISNRGYDVFVYAQTGV